MAFTAPPPAPGQRVLDLGCGQAKVPGAVGMDRLALPGVDVVHDLDRFPWPLEESSFDAIYCSHVIEHVREIIPVMEEIHRVGRPGADVHILTPHFSCSGSWRDPTHRWHLALESFNYFVPGYLFDYYSRARFEIIQSRIRLGGLPHWLSLDWLMNRCAGRGPLRKLRQNWERHFCYLLPGREMFFHLRVVKAAPETSPGAGSGAS